MVTHELLTDVLRASRTLHVSGSLSPSALVTLAGKLANKEIRHSAETGAGASTLLFSHCSENHTVFSLDVDGSISAVRSHKCFHPEATRFIEGPTQKTLPGWHFPDPLQAVLIDGPHAYPFPDLEYFYFYPHLDVGGYWFSMTYTYPPYITCSNSSEMTTCSHLTRCPVELLSSFALRRPRSTRSLINGGCRSTISVHCASMTGSEP